MATKTHKQEELDELNVVYTIDTVNPDFMFQHSFVVATANGMSDLEKKARDAFINVDFLPRAVFIPKKNELKVGEATVHYALVRGIYLR
ncbi:MAG: hypothetical protein Q8O89_04555 [Nanoarchaeota archaeon]|nr:hypothetical protein [Nanoarchaeota archaeon]